MCCNCIEPKPIVLQLSFLQLYAVGGSTETFPLAHVDHSYIALAHTSRVLRDLLEFN